MKKPAFLAALVTAFAASFAIGCAAPTDAADDAPEAVVAEVGGSSVETDSVDGDDSTLAEASDVGATGFGGDVANIILGKLQNHAIDLLLNQIGMGNTTPDQLDKIIAQLEQIERTLIDTRDQLNKAIAASALSEKIANTYAAVTAIQETLHRYSKIANLEKQILLARANGDLQSAEALGFDQERAVLEFVRAYDSGGTMKGALGVLHKVIAGLEREENLIDLYRWKLRSDGRFLTHAHSESLAAGYSFFENYEALAAFLTAECNAAVQYGAESRNPVWPTVRNNDCSLDSNENERVGRLLQGYVDVQRAKLPTQIPVGALVDQVSNFTAINGNTLNKPMFLSVDGTYTWRPSDTVNTAGSVRHRVSQIVRTGGDGEWKVPTSAELATLLPGCKGSMVDCMNVVFRTEGRFQGQTFIWTSNTQSQSILYDRQAAGEHGWWDLTKTYQTYTGWTAHATAARNEVFPKMPAGDYRWKSVARADEAANAAWAATKGGVVVTRSTGPTNYM